jgi:hypothetical protein
LTIAKTIAPRVKCPRGEKPSASSIAHELFLEKQGRKGAFYYTLDTETEDFTDPATQATRVEFNEPLFDPRPAARRLKRGRRVASNQA